MTNERLEQDYLQTQQRCYRSIFLEKIKQSLRRMLNKLANFFMKHFQKRIMMKITNVDRVINKVKEMI